MAYVLDYKARIQSLGEVFVEDMGGLLTPEDIAIYTAGDFNNCSQYQGRPLQ